ncbi:respiratory nitrate reductase subunit gamma [Caldivirga sp.]|uniref:respiratory nitrate reductase subunit gamma n=1 Tax=Caldivirga sp. TaxID=2080243 RepID=UPI0025C0BBCB|nr:respiratory nitrate reductase subunit gamma [Caldivirga sp.]
MYNALTYSLYFILPYVSLVILVCGVLYRIALWLNAGKGPLGLYLGLYRLVIKPRQESFLGSVKHILARMFTYYTILGTSYRRDYSTWLGVLLFHWGIFLLIAFHLHLWLPQLTVPESVMFTLGTMVGALTLASGVFLLVRRIRVQRIYRVIINYLDDYVAVSWVIVIVVLGLALRLTAPSSLFNEATKWALGLTSFKYIPPPSNLLFYAHVLAVELFMMYIPFAKMIHPFSMPVNPALYGKFEDINEVKKRILKELGW